MKLNQTITTINLQLISQSTQMFILQTIAKILKIYRIRYLERKVLNKRIYWAIMSHKMKLITFIKTSIT